MSDLHWEPPVISEAEVEWKDEKREHALEFLKVKMAALQTQEVKVPALTYKIGISGSKTIRLHSDNLTYWGVLEQLRLRNDLVVTIEAAGIHVESR